MHLRDAVSAFRHTDEGRSHLQGCRREPPSPLAPRAVSEVPQGAMTSWSLPEALGSEGTDFSCPQTLAQRKSSTSTEVLYPGN